MTAAASAGAGAEDARPSRDGPARVWLEVALAAALYALATPWVLRPWFLAADLLPHVPGAIGSMLDADLYLNIWILAWIAHAALTDPARIYDGNIFHPAPNTIAGSENMLAHLPVTAAALWASDSALVMLKAYVFECFVLSGVGMFLFVRHHTRSAAAALLAGAAYTFTAFRVGTIPQPQYLGIAFLPLALLCVDLWLERRRAIWLVALAAAVGLQALSCVYVGFFTLCVVPVYALVRLASLRERRGSAAVGIVAALAGGVALAAPASLPYLRARAEGVIPRHDPSLIRLVSWAPWEYLSRAFLERAGIVPVALVLLDVATRTWRRLRRVASPRGATPSVERALWAVALVAVVLSAGPTLELGSLSIPLPYQLLYEVVPGFSSIRVPIRFSIVVAMALSALAGFAIAGWTRTLDRRVTWALAGVLAIACVIDAAPRPAPVVEARVGAAAPDVYTWLAEQQPADGAVVEVPGTAGVYDVVGNLRGGRAMLASTIHWKPLVNGWTAYPPHAAGLLAAAIASLPEPQAVHLLAATSNLRWIVVHRDQMLGEERELWPRSDLPGLALVRSFGDVDVYEVRTQPARDLRGEVIARSAAPTADTLQGAPTTPLPDACRNARIDAIDAPPRVLPIPSGRRVQVRFTNLGTCTWPALGVRPEGLVVLGYRWTSPAGKSDPPGPVTRLLADVPPGATVDATMLVTPPVGEFGMWTLDVFLLQDGVAEPIASASRQVELRAPGGRKQRPGDAAGANAQPRDSAGAKAQPGDAGSSS